MHAVQWLMVAVLASVGLAGCLSNDDSGAQDVDPIDEIQRVTSNPNYDAGLRIADSPRNSHESFGWPVYLPVDGKIAGGWDMPAMRQLPNPISSITQLAGVEGTSTGGGIAVFGDLAFIGVRSGLGPMQVVDISDPENPVVVGQALAPVRDADTIAFPDGRLIVITTAGGAYQYATDVTDPTNPQVLAEFGTPHGNHNIAVVPGTPIVYNSGSGGIIDIVDYSVPALPQLVGNFTNGNGCHDITFFIDQENDKYRAYCAGYPETEIWDITDPYAPTMIIEIPYPSANEGLPANGGPAPDLGTWPGSFSHLALPSHDGNVLIMGDETFGGLGNFCDVYADAGGQSVSGPSGNLWFYDITDETAPVLHGHMSPSWVDGAGGSCTAHFGRVIEDKPLVVMGFYAAGVALVDFSDLDNPIMVDRYDPAPTSGPSAGIPPSAGGASIWDVWYYQGYLFTGDMNQGMEVLTFA